MAESTVLVLGCGLGGVIAAKEIRRRLGRNGRVVAIDRDPTASFTPSYLWVMSGERRARTITRQRARLARHGVELVTAEVREVDLTNRLVRADSREIRYDFLVFALGAETDFEELPGLGEATHSLYSLEGAEHMAAALRYFAGGRVVVLVSRLPYKGPAVPYETAMLMEQHFHARRMRQKVQIEVHTPESQPLTFAGEAIGDEVRGFLAHKGIEVVTGRSLSSVDARGKSLHFEDGSAVSFDMLVATPRHRAAAIASDSGLADDSGWIPVSPETLATDLSGVYAIGDVARVVTPAGLDLPKSAFVAAQQASAVARQIEARIKGNTGVKPYEGEERFFVDVGAGAAARVRGRLLGSNPGLELNQPSIVWHWARRALERNWLWRTY